MSRLKLYMVLVVVMFVWGMNLPALKYLTAQMGPVTMTSLRIFLAAATVFAILFMMGLVRKPMKKEWGYIIGGPLLNVVAHHCFISIGLSLTTGTNAGLILGTGPILTAIFSLLLLRIIPSKWQWLGLFLGLFGVAATVMAGNTGPAKISIGDVYVLIAILSQVLSFIVISKASKTLDPRLLTAYMLMFGSIGLFMISLVLEPGEWRAFSEMNSAFWLLLLASGVIATGIGHMIYNYAVGEAGPSKAAIFMNLNTLFGLFGSVFFLGEILTSHHLTGLILIVAGVFFGSGTAEEWWSRKIKANAAKEERQKVSRAKN